MDLGIEGKVALVTGGSRGIGLECAKSLAQEGVNVAICGRTEKTLTQTVDELTDMGVKSVGIKADIADLSTMEFLSKKVVAELGSIDILVNNVGGSKSNSDIMGTSLGEFKATFDLNLFGSLELMKLVIPSMRECKWGRIINIASIWGREYGGSISYMSAKAALIGATKNAAMTLVRDGILVNSIAPGRILHPDGYWERFQNENSSETIESFIEQNLPMGKFGWPEAVGDLVAFLSSNRSSLVTGACIVIDGGQSKSMI